MNSLDAQLREEFETAKSIMAHDYNLLKERLAAAEQRNAEARRLLDIASMRMATWLTYKEPPRAEIIEFLTNTAKPTESGARE
jgi:hypothetical protein